MLNLQHYHFSIRLQKFGMRKRDVTFPSSLKKNCPLCSTFHRTKLIHKTKMGMPSTWNPLVPMSKMLPLHFDLHGAWSSSLLSIHYGFGQISPLDSTCIKVQSIIQLTSCIYILSKDI